MQSYRIMLRNIDDISEFVSIAVEYPMDIDINDNRMVIDGKSFLGVASLLNRFRSGSLLLTCTEKDSEFESRIRKFLTAA